MNGLLATLGTALDLLLVVLGFGLVVFIHELGHFVAARWAGIRVLTFAIGFGPPLISYRRGIGWRRGSTAHEYEQRLKADARGPADLSPTEYRLSALPFGGYVKMLGQDDTDPSAVSDAPDSFQSAPPWKRLIVISAGVVMNVVLAAVLFILVFLAGLQVEPARIGGVAPGSPAAKAVARNAGELGVTEPGLRPGDRIIRAGGREPNSFQDLVLASAMGGPDRPVRLTVERPGVEAPLHFRITPERGRVTGLYEIGIAPARSPRLFEVETGDERERFREAIAELGLEGVEPGMRLVRIGDVEDVRDAAQLHDVARRSRGQPMELVFEGSDGERLTARVTPRPELEQDAVVMPGGERQSIEHLLGLTPVLSVLEAQPAAREQGLEDEDVFARLGSVAYPSIPEGIAEIRAHKGRTIEAVILREAEAGPIEIPMTLEVSSRGQGSIGFYVDDTARSSTLLARPPAELEEIETGATYTPAAVRLIESPGTRIREIAGLPVETLAEARVALAEATQDAHEQGLAEAAVEMTLEIPSGSEAPSEPERRGWTLIRPDLDRLHALGWTSPIPTTVFEPERTELRASGPLEAVVMGVEETHRVMMTTYATFERLWAGTVQIQHLKGPVGIAHVGTRIASKGIIWLLFFLAIISVNLAVINFLPLPIVDGGQFLLITWEQIRGRPVPIPIQNAITLAGLVLIGTVFLIVTFNDLRALFMG